MRLSIIVLFRFEEVVDNEKIFDLENIKKMLNDLKNEK